MKFTGERAVEDETPKRIWLDHVSRYNFSKKYVNKKRVLDISCGTGYGSKILCDSGAKEVIGVDISKDAVKFANSLYKSKRLHFKLGDIKNINYKDNTFDIITCFETIEHIEDQEKVFRELQRVLKPEGLLIISSPNRKLTSPNRPSDHPYNPFHKIEYSTKEFIFILGNYFEVLEVYGQRGVNKLLFFLSIDKVLRIILPFLYSPERGDSKLEKINPSKEYRYITIVCRKKDFSSSS